MTFRKTAIIAIALTLTAILTSLCYGGEAETKPALKYKFVTDAVSSTRKQTAQPAIVPTHKASFYVEWYHRAPVAPDIAVVLQTDAGASISQLQREFVKTGRDVTSELVSQAYGSSLLGEKYRSGRMRYELYAVSRDDACNMAEAYIDVLLRENNAALKPLLDEYLGKFQDQQRKLKQDIADARQKIPKKEQELKDLRLEYTALKKARWYQSSDQAQKAMLELNTILNTESIELAGLLAKRKAIERHRRDVEQKVKNRSTSIKERWEPIIRHLEQKYIDLMIDLDVARAREQTALELRKQAQEFLDLSGRVNQLNGEVARLPRHIRQLESDLAPLEKLLAQPKPAMLPLQVYKNEVHIRPVAVRFTE